MDKTMLHKGLKAGYMEQHVLHPTDAGTPQGGVASPILASLTLDGLERLLREHFPKPRSGYNAKVNLVRFADDLIITGDSKELPEMQVRPLVEASLSERGLDLSPEKTSITHVVEGFDFLGQHVRKYRGTLLITPSRKNVKAFLDKVRGMIRGNKQATAGHLILQLNPVIRNWALYHRHVVSKATYTAVDMAIFKSLWRWAKRRHPRKAARWVRRKYFAAQGDRDWVFSGQAPAEGRRPARMVRLFSAASLPIRGHIQARAGANPYDPAWEVYLETRLGVKMENQLSGRRKLLHLWQEQDGRCPVCQQRIAELTGWHSHHVVWRSRGGSDGAANRVLLHPNCHRLVHSQGITVLKPRPAQGRRRGLSCLRGNSHEPF